MVCDGRTIGPDVRYVLGGTRSEHYLAERVWFCWLADNPAAYLEHPERLANLEEYAPRLWESFNKHISSVFASLAYSHLTTSIRVGVAHLIRPFASLLCGYLMVFQYEQPQGSEYTLDGKKMPRRKSYTKRAKRFLPSVSPRDAAGQSAGEHLKTRLWALMLDDLAKARVHRKAAILIIARIWEILDQDTDPESVRRSLLRIRPIT